MENKRLTTRQFADLCKVEKRTLFYYDEIDLLKPAQVNEKGYRYYLPEQFDTMSMIKALQSVGMPLNDIKALMNEQDIAHCKMVLENQNSSHKGKARGAKTRRASLKSYNGGAGAFS